MRTATRLSFTILTLLTSILPFLQPGDARRPFTWHDSIVIYRYPAGRSGQRTVAEMQRSGLRQEQDYNYILGQRTQRYRYTQEELAEWQRVMERHPMSLLHNNEAVLNITQPAVYYLVRPAIRLRSLSDDGLRTVLEPRRWPGFLASSPLYVASARFGIRAPADAYFDGVINVVVDNKAVSV